MCVCVSIRKGTTLDRVVVDAALGLYHLHMHSGTMFVLFCFCVWFRSIRTSAHRTNAFSAVVHRDIAARNILLDENYRAKVSGQRNDSAFIDRIATFFFSRPDFGMARVQDSAEEVL